MIIIYFERKVGRAAVVDVETSGWSALDRCCCRLAWSLARLEAGRCIVLLVIWLGGRLALRCRSLILALSAFGVIPLAEELEVVDADFGGVALVACLVGPGPGAQAAFYIELCAFADESLGHVSRVSPGYDVVPFGVFAEFSVAIPEPFGGCEGESGDFCSLSILLISFEVTYFRVSTNVTDEHYFVE